MADDAPAKKTPPTIRSVADDAGVSVAAVSKVLRNAYGVSAALRANVMKSIDKLGYRPSTAARAMRGRTYTIGLLLVYMDNTFLADVVEGLKQVLASANYQLMIGVGDAEAAIERSLIDSMLDMRLDGILLVAPRLDGALMEDYAQKIPMAVIGHHQATAEHFDTINSDDRKGARLATEALIEAGRQHIHMVSLPDVAGGVAVSSVREDGYLEAMQAAGRAETAKIWRLQERPGQAGATIDTVFGSAPRPDGLFCWSDIHALKILNHAALEGIDVPTDLAVIGYDNRPEAQMPLINLSSIDQSACDLGRIAGETLLSRIEGRSLPEHILIEPVLVNRQSTRPYNQRGG